MLLVPGAASATHTLRIEDADVMEGDFTMGLTWLRFKVKVDTPLGYSFPVNLQLVGGTATPQEDFDANGPADLSPLSCQ